MNDVLMDLSEETSRNLGVQPLDAIMTERGLRNADLVKASAEPMTHKMVQRGRKGRLLSRRVQERICRALGTAAGRSYALDELFNYKGKP